MTPLAVTEENTKYEATSGASRVSREALSDGGIHEIPGRINTENFFYPHKIRQKKSDATGVKAARDIFYR
jgi:hypothetical protein